MNFKNIIIEELDKVKSNKISVFDFDGTLVDTALPEYGKKIWKDKTGTDWPHIGWWGRIESLDMDVFDNPTLPSVISAYNKERSNPNTTVVMLTGRREKLSSGVEAILAQKGLTFDQYLYNYGGETSQNKKEQMGNMLDELPNVRYIEMWDDRTEHIKTFEDWGNELVSSGRLDGFKVNHVISDHHN